MIPEGFPLNAPTDPPLPTEEQSWFLPILLAIPIRPPPAYVRGKRTRELIGLALLCALVLANERGEGVNVAHAIFLHSLASILPKHTGAQRQSIARKWFVYHI